jgi:hypothetical protein
LGARVHPCKDKEQWYALSLSRWTRVELVEFVGTLDQLDVDLKETMRVEDLYKKIYGQTMDEQMGQGPGQGSNQPNGKGRSKTKPTLSDLRQNIQARITDLKNETRKKGGHKGAS